MKKVAVRLGVLAFVVALLCLGLLKEAAPIFWEETLPKDYVLTTLYGSLAVLGFLGLGVMVGFVATSGLAVLSAIVILALYSWPLALIVGVVLFIAWDQLKGIKSDSGLDKASVNNNFQRPDVFEDKGIDTSYKAIGTPFYSGGEQVKMPNEE